MKKPAKPPTLPRISDEMKAWCAALAAEVSEWPSVEARPFFGFTALYRGKRMFAALPRTRALESADALAFKLDPLLPKLRASLEGDSRIAQFGKDKERWYLFEISSGADLHDALGWLSRAYRVAGSCRKSN